jgi:hypothetical protein
MEDMFSVLEQAGVARDELHLAWEFNIASVENITGRLLHIRDQAFADLGGAAPEFAITEVIDFQTCGDDGCQDGEDEEISRQVSGTFMVPNFLDTGWGIRLQVSNPKHDDSSRIQPSIERRLLGNEVG